MKLDKNELIKTVRGLGFIADKQRDYRSKVELLYIQF